jgi:hypothetical protein
MEVAHYYRHHVIRDRMVEFLGGSSLEDATAVFLTGSDGSEDPERRLMAKPPPPNEHVITTENVDQGCANWCCDVDRHTADFRCFSTGRIDSGDERGSAWQNDGFHDSGFVSIVQPV